MKNIGRERVVSLDDVDDILTAFLRDYIVSLSESEQVRNSLQKALELPAEEQPAAIQAVLQIHLLKLDKERGALKEDALDAPTVN